jgi:hypothetical protein
MVMTIQYHHRQFEEATSAIRCGIRVAGGHISKLMWQTRGKYYDDFKLDIN